MSKTYNDHEHSHVTIGHPKAASARDEWMDEAWRGTHAIVLHVGSHVWIMTGYEAEGHPDVKRVTDGRNDGYDDHGGCILSVPASWCTYLTADEAESVERMIDADDRLLRYAL